MKRDMVRRAGVRVVVCVALLATLGVAEAVAQTRQRSSTMRVELPMPPVAETPVPLVDGGADGRLNTLSFTTPDATFGRSVVKGAPFTAESVTEHVQRLADGNR